MVSKYVKALLLTAALTALGLFLISYLDGQRVSSISDELESLSLDAQDSQQLLFYEGVFGDTEAICPGLSRMIDRQVESTRDVLARFEAAQSQNLIGDTSLLKRKYLSQNVQLYLLAEKYRRDCADSGPGIVPLVYFYTDKSFVPDEAAQQKALDSLVLECPNVRVFALPQDLGIPVVDVLIAKHGISAFPAMVAGDSKFEGLQPVNSVGLKAAIGCQ